MSDASPNPAAFSCPVPLTQQAEIQMAHGGGGRLTQQLIDRVFAPAFRNAALDARHDGALLPAPPPGTRLAFTTDSHVVSPLFFPGGDIGALAVHGTVNDLAMCGARPKWLSAGFILEEGLPIATLERVVASMGAAARAAGVEIVTGDTKVVERGKGDGLYVNTAGVGWIEHGADDCADVGAGGRRRPAQRRCGPARHGDSRAARGAGVRVAHRERFRAAVAGGGGAAGGGHRGALSARFDARRTRDGRDRDRRGGGIWRWHWTKRRCR
jgi:hypothetical protein